MPVDSRITFKEGSDSVEGTLVCDICGNEFAHKESFRKGSDKAERWNVKVKVSDLLGQHSHG